MKRSLNLLSFGLIILFTLGITVNAKDLSSWEDLKDCLINTTDEVCKLTGNIDGLAETVEITGVKTLDLNGKDLSMLTTIKVKNGANLTITGNGKIVTSSAYDVVYAQTGSEVYVEDAELLSLTKTGSSIFLRGDVVGGTLETKVKVGKNSKLGGTYGIMIEGNSSDKTQCEDVVIDIYGTMEGYVNEEWGIGSSAVYINGKVKATDNSIIINVHDDSLLKGVDGPGIYAAGYAIWNIGKATIEGPESLSIKAGKFVIDGANLNSDGKYVNPEDVKDDANASEETGAAVSITSNSKYNGNIDVTIKNSTIESKNGYALFEKITYGDTNQIKNLFIENSELTGNVGPIYSGNGLTQFIKSGKFNKEINMVFIKDESLGAMIDDVYYVELARTIEIEEVENGTVELEESLVKAIKGQLVELTITPSEGYYLKNIRVYNKEDETEYLDVSNENFEMPDYNILIVPEFEEYLDKAENIITTKPNLEIDPSIESDLVEEIGEVKVDKTLIDAIDVENIISSSNDLVEVKIDAKLEKVEENEGKVSLVFNIKPIYKVNGEDKGILPNDMLNGDKIKIKLPVPSSITDTHAKVTHIDDQGEVISEDEYEVIIDGEDKYVEIETESFSEFKVDFYTPEDDDLEEDDNLDTEDKDEEITNPQTGNSLTASILTLIISFTILSISFVIYRNKKTIIIKR